MSEGLRNASDADLLAELERRGRVPRCPCRRWRVYLGRWDRDGYTWRCRGCLLAIGRCTCR